VEASPFPTDPLSLRVTLPLPRSAMDLAAICEVLAATQLPDETIRKAAEAKLTEAKDNNPCALVQALVTVLAAGTNVKPELRQEAAVLLRQRVKNDWDKLDAMTIKALMVQVLATVEGDPEKSVQRSAGSVMTSVVQEICPDDIAALMGSWPELLPWLGTFSGPGAGSPATRVVALTVLNELVPVVGAEMIAKGDQVKQMLEKALSDPAAEVRAAGAALVLAFVQHLDEDAHEQMAIAMPAVNAVLQGFATGSTEKELEETLGALVTSTEAEPEFFLRNSFESLWTTLMTICQADAAVFANPEIKHVAMECIMTLAEGNSDEQEFTPCLEGVVMANFQFMLAVEEDVTVWTAEGKDTGDDECDDDLMRIGEENFDRLGTSYDEEEFMPVIFKVVNAALQQNQTDWKCIRSAIMACSQVFEHLEDEAQVDLCIDLILRHFTNEHPRVRYTAFSAIAQASYDQSDRVQEKYAADLVPLLIKGMQDPNIRVVTSAVEAFSAIGEGLDSDEVEDHMEELLKLLFKHLDAGESRHLQEQCIDAIAAAAQGAEELFSQYYGTVMPLLKQIIATATKEEQRTLRGKAFLCTSEIGNVVGKELFHADACEIMNIITPLLQGGFAADDKTREFTHEAAGNIVQILGKDFKPYVAPLLPSIFAVLKQAPSDISELLEDDADLDDIILNDLGSLGLKTSVLEEMDEALELVILLVKGLDEDFCDFIGPSCQALMPVLDYPLSDDVRDTVFRTWGALTSSARAAVMAGKLDPTVLRELATGFLQKTVGEMGQGKPEDVCENNVCTCSKIQTLAAGAADVIQKAGPGVLTKDAMTDVARVTGSLLAAIEVTSDGSADGKKKKKLPEGIDDDEEEYTGEDEEDDDSPTPQSVRFALVDIMSALMRNNQAEFDAEVLPTFMGQLVQKLIQPNSNEADRGLAFHIADRVVDEMGPASVKYWQGFMNHALVAVVDKSPVVRQYATKVIGNGAKQKEYSIMALAACQNIVQVLQKHGEKHKRRRVKANQKPVGIAIDACVRALGLICEHQEQALGAHAAQVWSMWIAALPVKYDVDAGKLMNTQLLGLLAREHPAIANATSLPTVLKALTDVYKTKFSTSELDKNIAFAFAQLGAEKLEVLCTGFKDSQKKKTEQMLKNAKAAASA